MRWQPDQTFFNNFPRLDAGRSNWQHTSPPSDKYNCVAYVADDRDHIWWPKDCGHWPVGCPNEETVESFVRTFALLGYSPCGTPALEQGLQKIAIFANADGEPTHMATQATDRGGWWRSKLGTGVDIEHELEAIGGGIYGEVSRVLARERKGRYSTPVLADVSTR